MKPAAVLSFAALVLGVSLAAPSVAAGDPPEVLVRSTTEEVLDIIGATADHRRLAQRLEPVVMPHFDFTRMTRLAVGRAWSKATPEQRRRLQEEFTTLLVRTYANGLASVAGKRFSLKMAPTPVARNGDEAMVRTRILAEGRKPVSVDYEMELAGAEWKVFDVVVEGISLVTTSRSAFGAEIEKSGIDGLIGALAEKNRGLAEPAAKPEAR